VAAAARPAAWAQRFLLQLLRDALASPEPPPPPALSQLLHALDVVTVAAAAEAAVQWPVRNPTLKSFTAATSATSERRKGSLSGLPLSPPGLSRGVHDSGAALV